MKSAPKWIMTLLAIVACLSAIAADKPNTNSPMPPVGASAKPTTSSVGRWPNDNMPISRRWRRTPPLNAEKLPPETAVRRPRGKPSSGKIDINSCSLEDLQNLPGVGAAMGGHIMAGRPFRNFDDLIRDGVPLNVVDRLRGMVEFGP